MKTCLDSTCPRCGFRSSSSGLSVETARELATIHTCADGVMVAGSEPIVRMVPGPGERTKLPEERDRW